MRSPGGCQPSWGTPGAATAGSGTGSPRHALDMLPSFAPLLDPILTKSPWLVGTAQPPHVGTDWKFDIRSGLWVNPPLPNTTALRASTLIGPFGELAVTPITCPEALRSIPLTACRRRMGTFCASSHARSRSEE